ncbi:hypothetical protein [Motiliproteus sediminis]|uniref:hypothetical protein n=1 Tax=Motiliproteus sediminis TaxID=1468178 RepID=UPI001AEF7844|nr:hypothetical protein [Motiliproteus sediminis]
MSSEVQTILLGVPSGVVAAFLVWFVAVVWNSAFTPWIRKQIYRGVELTGQWNATLMSDEAGNSTDSIENAVSSISYMLSIEKQYGHQLKGWFSQDFKEGDKSTHGRYLVDGQVVDGTLVLSLKPADKSKSAFGTLLMNISSAGNKIEGQYTFKGSRTNKIQSVGISLGKNQR